MTGGFLARMAAAGNPGTEKIPFAKRRLLDRAGSAQCWVVRPVDRDDFGERRGHYAAGLALTTDGAWHALHSKLTGYGQRDFPSYWHTLDPEPLGEPDDPAVAARLEELLREHDVRPDPEVSTAAPARSGRLAGKVALISGTGQAIGRAAALRFAQEGARVFGGDLLEGPAAETATLVERAGGTMDTVARLDVTDEGSVQAWVQAAVARFGTVDVLYNNAGAARSAAIEAQSYADWRFTLEAELDSVFLASKHAWEPLKRNGGGAIVNVGSTAGISGSVTNARVAHTASKGGVIAVTRQLAAEGARHGIRANAVSPGMISTVGARETLLHSGDPTSAIALSIPLGRLGTPEDVVGVALFLASDEAAYVTGANFVVDGGWSAVLPGGS